MATSVLLEIPRGITETEHPLRADPKILLVVPRYNLTDKVDYNYTFPLGLGYISATLKKDGYDVTILNLNHCKGTISDVLKKELDRKDYDIVGTGHTGMGYSVVKKIVGFAQEHPSKPKIILGGALITSEPELMVKALRPDFAVISEGERTILELLDCIEENSDPKNVKGIIYLDGQGQVVITAPREPIENIDALPSPDFEGLGFGEFLGYQFTNKFYYNNQFDEPRAYPMLASRSCPFQCTFCYHAIGRKYRERSMESIMDELEHAVKKYRVNIINLYDDLFSYKKERIYEFCKRIKKLAGEVPWKIKWTCQLSVVTMDKDMLREMKESGCDIISYGFESYSQEVLKSMKKPITPQQIDFAFKSTLESKMSVQANFIFGDVAETKETAKTTLDYWKNNCQGQVSLLFIQPYPGSEIYQHCVRKGLIKDKLNYIENDMNRATLFNMTDKMTDEEVKELDREIQKLRMQYGKFVTPAQLKRMNNEGVKDERYEVKVDCPFCSKEITYKNYCLQSKLMHQSYMICRDCNMRFNILSPLMKVSKDFYFLPTVEKYYRKITKLLWKTVR